MEHWSALAALLAICLLCGCSGTITSNGPLLTSTNASYPLPSGAELTGERLDDGGVWERDERKGRIGVVDGSYRVTGPDASSPSSDTFLFKRVGGDEFIVQGSNGSEWAYGLIVHADMYYLFTFNRAGENCTTLSAEARGRWHVAVRNDRCYVASLRDLIGLLRYLRRQFPRSTSAFVVREVAR